jgi:hypothetical protein
MMICALAMKLGTLLSHQQVCDATRVQVTPHGRGTTLEDVQPEV